LTKNVQCRTNSNVVHNKQNTKMQNLSEKVRQPYSKSKLELNSKKVELEWCKKIFCAFYSSLSFAWLS